MTESASFLIDPIGASQRIPFPSFAWHLKMPRVKRDDAFGACDSAACMMNEPFSPGRPPDWPGLAQDRRDGTEKSGAKLGVRLLCAPPPPRTHPFRTITPILAPEPSVLVRKAQCPFLTRSRGQTAKISAVTGMVGARTGAASAGTAPPSCQPFCVTRRSRPPNRCLSLFLMRLKLSGWSPPALRSPRAPHD